MKTKSTTCLRNWIGNHGTKKVAQKLGVAESTVRHWRCGRHLPKLEHLNLLCHLSKGALTHDLVIHEFLKGRGA